MRTRARLRTVAAALALAWGFAGVVRADDAPVGQGVPPVSPAPAGGPRADAPPTPPSPTPPAPTEASPGGFRRTDEGLLEFHARGLDVAEAFAQLRRLMKRNIVVSPEIRVRFTGDLYDVTLPQAVDAICRSAGLVMREENGLLFIEPSSIQCRIFKLSYARAADVQPMIEPLLSASGKLKATGSAEVGIKASQDEAGGDNYANSDTIVVSDFAVNLDRIEAAIRALDGRPKQILMEATLIEANVEDGTSMGVEFKALEGIDFRKIGATSLGGQNLTLGQVPARNLDDGVASAVTNTLAGLPNGGLTFGILKNDVGVFVKALATTTDVHVMANPKVMVLNKQRGEVIVGRRDGYLTTTTTTTSTTQKVEFIETGTRLLFRPFVGEDGMIRLEIHPEDSNGGVTPQGLPFKETVEVTTNILVAPGKTVVIGGLFRDRTEDSTTGVPLMQDIPLIGAAFRSTNKTKRRQEILILLTPRIVDPSADMDEDQAWDGDEDDSAAPAKRAADGTVVVLNADDPARAKRELESQRAEVERLKKDAEAARAAVAADVARAVEAAKTAQAVQDEERKKAAAAAKAVQDAQAEQAKRAAEESAADAAAKAAEAEAAELEQKLAKARDAAKQARETKAAKAAESEEAGKKALALKAEEAARAAEAAKAAQAAEDAKKAAESAEARKSELAQNPAAGK